MQADGAVFMQEDRADNAFVCASVEFLTIGEREDGWHTDCGASQLHAAVTVFGSRTVLVKLDQPSLLPRSFYVGNLCAVAETTSDPVATWQPGPSSSAWDAHSEYVGVVDSTAGRA